MNEGEAKGPRTAGGAAKAADPGIRVYLALAWVQLFFGSLSVVLKVVLRFIRPSGAVAFRVLGATLILHAVAGWRGRERVASWRDHARFAALSLFGVVLNQGLFVTGVAHTTAINATVLGSTAMPLFTSALVLMSAQERFVPLRVAGVVTAGSGALYLLGADAVRFGHETAVGDLLVLGNALSYSIFLVRGRSVLRRYRPETVVLWMFTYANLVVLPWAAPHLIADLGRRPPLLLWLLVAYLVLGPTVGAYRLNAFALRFAPASLVAAFVYAQPVVSAALAILVLHERLTWHQVAGASIVLAGLWLASTEGRALPLRRPRSQ